MSKGIVLFGINNTKINYVRLAEICAMFIHKNMPGTNVSLVTVPSSLEHASNKSLFDKIIFINEMKIDKFENKRKYLDTQYHSVVSNFRNESRSSVYDISPYDETILLDSDYLVCSQLLNNCWGNVEDLMINRDAISMKQEALTGDEFRVSPFGIKMFWATIIYFKKSEKGKLLFDLVEHIKENWIFYKMTYNFPGELFRNDYAFSIALHILNGLNDGHSIAKQLPNPRILTATDRDRLISVNSPTSLTFLIQDKYDVWKYNVTKTDGLDVHCMNKLSMLNNYDKIKEILHV